MKYLIAACWLFLGILPLAHAQEMLLPLHHNPTQRLDEQAKGYRRDFSTFCYGAEHIGISQPQSPTCLLGDGSLQLQIQNIATPYTLSYTGTGTSNSGILNGLTDEQINLPNLRAGAYFITITDAEGRVKRYTYELNNADAEATLAEHWEIVAPFCDQPGKLRKRAFTPGAVGEFRLYDSNHALIANYNGSTQISTPLPAGTYYLQRQESSGCRSFYIFDVVPIPTIAVPFTEDFSASSVVPDARYWASGCVLINDSYVAQPFTSGVATFDGLDCVGQPYTPVPTGAELIDGNADVLTSHPACMATSTPDLAPRDTLKLLSSSIVQLSGLITIGSNPVDVSGTYYWVGDELYAIDQLNISGNGFVPIGDSLYTVTSAITLPNGEAIQPDQIVSLPNFDLMSGAPSDFFNLSGLSIEIGGTMQAISGAASVAGIIWDLPATTFITPASDAYLSFLYQPRGRGDYPNLLDSLIVEIQTADEQWRKIWGIRGLGDVVEPYRYVSLRIVDSIATAATIWDGFRFRFRNNATVSGNNDHWHLDYVKLSAQSLTIDDDSLAFTNLDYKDSGFANNPPSMLRRYQAMPWKHFVGHANTELKPQTDYVVGVTNTSTSADNRLLTYTLREACSETLLFELSGTGVDPNDIGNFTGTQPLNFFFNKDNINLALDQNTALFEGRDSVVLENRLSLDSDINDKVTDNDTVYQYQTFFNYFAYDDGVAEKAYGLYGVNGKLAARFVLNVPDTLRALQIAFVAQNQDIENLPFKLAVWKSVQLNTNNDELIYLSSDDFVPQFLAQPNGLWTYLLEQPLAVSDTIYVGFVQAEADFLPVAFDVNNSYGYDIDSEVNSEIFYNATGQWYNSLYQGALLLRPVLGESLNAETINVGIEPTPKPEQTLRLYPNPTHTAFRLSDSHTAHTAEIYDCMGRLLSRHAADEDISVAHLPAGIYIVKAYDRQGQTLGLQKLIVQQ
ncbi:MAG: T9SS type A sorting domain-containing protein [Chitinophagales bacterium]|nr:T9SS type A sorting domain-containing protein [Chitinophagales bacterium]